MSDALSATTESHNSVVFLDTETTGLDPETERVFEVAIVAQSGSAATWHLKPSTEVVGRMHPKAVEVNRFHERTASPDWWWDDTEQALVAIKQNLNGVHICGAVPDFDTRFLTAEYKRAGIEPPRWHYHLIDVEALAVGYCAAKGIPFALPWDSDELSKAVGVEPDTHTHEALADALWAKRIWEAITGGR